MSSHGMTIRGDVVATIVVNASTHCLGVASSGR